MSRTIIPTVFNSGVKRLRPANLGAWSMLGRGLGDVSDDIDGMVAEGYDPSILSSLAVMGATDAQLQSLWDNYGAGTPEFSDAAQALMLQLSAPSLAPPPVNMQTSAAGAAYGAVNSIIQFGSTTLDLTQDSAWSYLSNQFTATQAALNQLAAQFPGDASVAQNIQQFNSLALQFASYWQQVYGSSMSSIPLASTTGMGGLGTLGIAPLVIAGIVAAVALMAAGLYAIIQWIAVKKTQASTAQTQVASTTATASQLTTSYQQLLAQAAAATAAGNPTLAAQLNSQAAATLAAVQKVGGVVTPSTSVDFSVWFQQNWGWLMIGLGAIVIVPAVLKKI